MSQIPYARQEIADADVAAVTEALRDAMLTQGPRVDRFEERFAEAVGARYAVAFNSGTAALHAAYFAARVGPGAGVVTSPITFAATANAALYLGAPVRFADIDPATVLLDPASAAASAGPDVRVLAPVHFGGQVANMEALGRLATERGWIVIEDAAHALGATYRTGDGRDHQVGACAHSAMCCFSLHAVKHITTGEGGVVTTNDESLYRRLGRFRSHGITRDRGEMRRDDGPWYYEQHDLGYNYRITDFQCALGLSQLSRLGDFVTARRRLAERYDRALATMTHVRVPAVPAWSRGAYHLYVVRVAASVRRAVFEGLRASGIGANVHYLPVYRHPYYRLHGCADVRRPHAEAYYAETITLPMFATLTEGEVDRVVAALAEQLSIVGTKVGVGVTSGAGAAA